MTYIKRDLKTIIAAAAQHNQCEIRENFASPEEETTCFAIVGQYPNWLNVVIDASENFLTDCAEFGQVALPFSEADMRILLRYKFASEGNSQVIYWPGVV